MQLLKANSHWKVKGMRVEVTISTYPPLSDVLLESTMYPVMATSPLTPSLHKAWVPARHTASLFNTGYPSAPLMIKKVLQLTFHLPAAQRHHRTPWVLHSRHATSPSISCVMT